MKRLFVFMVVLLMPLLHMKAQYIWDSGHLKEVKMSLDTPLYKDALESLKHRADLALDAEPLSVMQKKKIPASGDKHDYMSLARYFWPDPSKPDGLPYISRDGYSNPELNDLDRNKLGDTAENVKTLSLAYFFTDDERYARKAVSLLKVWFIDEDTRMNPNLEYAQMVPGHNGDKGRCYGVLDTYSFVEMLDAVALLEDSEAFTEEDSAVLKKWFSDLLDWILASPQGKEEAASANNHGTAYDAQVIAFSLYSGREETARRIIEEFPEKRTFAQILPDGSQPHELSRTLAYHYSHYNLTHYIDVFLMARKLGISIDDAASDDGRNFYKAIDFLVPYIAPDGAERWPYEQISGFDDVSRKLCMDLYRIGRYLAPQRTGYIRIFEESGGCEDSSLFTLLYL